MFGLHQRYVSVAICAAVMIANQANIGQGRSLGKHSYGFAAFGADANPVNAARAGEGLEKVGDHGAVVRSCTPQ